MSWKRPNVKTRMEPLLGHLTAENHFILLDMASGDGLFAELLENIYPNTYILRSDIVRTENSKNFILHDINYPPFRSKSLDGVVLAQVLHYFSNSHRHVILDKILKLLVSPGRWILIIEYEEKKPRYWLPFPVSIFEFEGFAKRSESSQIKIIQIPDYNRPKFSCLIIK